jgi:3-phytase
MMHWKLAFLLSFIFATASAADGIPSKNDWVDQGTAIAPGNPGSWDVRLSGMFSPGAMVKKNGTYFLYYIGADGDRSTDGGPRNRALGVATSADGINFSKYGGNPIVTHLPHNNEEEGIFSVGATLGPTGDVVLYYGAMDAGSSTSSSVDSDGMVATSSDGFEFTVLGDVLDSSDSGVWGSGDELFPIGAFQNDGTWYVYYVYKGDAGRWDLGLGSGPSKTNLVDTRLALDLSDQVRGGTDINFLTGSTIVVHVVYGSTPRTIGVWTAPVADPANLSHRDDITDYTFPGNKQTTVFRDGNDWFLYYLEESAGSILVKTAQMQAIPQSVSVTATVETDPVPHGADSADDPAIWIHPTDSAQSTIIGTDKNGGLAVYNLSGQEIQYVPDGRLNNVDLRYNFPLAGSSVDLVTSANRSNDSIGIYAVNPSTGMLSNVAEGTILSGISVYGSCMYRSASSSEYYFFVNSKGGEVEQWHLFDNGAGRVRGSLVRTFDVGTQTEGCVADDEFGYLYIGEEDVGLWKYGAEPQDGSSRTSVDSTGSGGRLTADVEGVTIYYMSDQTGYLIVSSQGADEFAIYEREGNNAYLATFNIVDGPTIDGVADTDGIDVINVQLGSVFPQGLFVAQDVSNPGDNQNFKVVPWEDIALSMNPPLTIDLLWNPRDSTQPADTTPPVAPVNLRIE